MMADLGTKVTILEALPKILPGLRQGRHQGRRCGRSRGAASTCAPASRSTGHTPDGDGGTTVQFGDGETLDVDARRRVGRPPAATPTTSGSTAPAVEVDERGFVEVDECCRTGRARRLRRRRRHRHAGAGPRRLRRGHRRRSRTSSARTRCRSTTARCRGASTATPRSPSPGYSEEAAKEAGFDVVDVEAPLHRQRPGADRRRARRAW